MKRRSFLQGMALFGAVVAVPFKPRFDPEHCTQCGKWMRFGAQAFHVTFGFFCKSCYYLYPRGAA